jgi:hypothetical protein
MRRAQYGLGEQHKGLRVFTASAPRRIRITQNRMAHAWEIPDATKGCVTLRFRPRSDILSIR